jgi:hypothetical protein
MEHDLENRENSTYYTCTSYLSIWDTSAPTYKYCRIVWYEIAKVRSDLTRMSLVTVTGILVNNHNNGLAGFEFINFITLYLGYVSKQDPVALCAWPRG